MRSRLVDLRRTLHARPELGFTEIETAATVIRILSPVADSIAMGRDVGRHASTREGAFVTPTVLIDMPHDSALWRHEVFGPVVMIEPWHDVTSAIEAANDADTGLQAGVFTQDIDQALDVAERLRVGAVLINSSSDFRIDAMPFGGFKSSGVGREGVTIAVESFSEPKVVAIRRAARA